MTIHQNLIAGEWVGKDAIRNINPSHIDDVVGDAAAKAAFPAWSRSGILERHAKI
jgi:aldehyde dehydrogenase (NAD+)